MPVSRILVAAAFAAGFLPAASVAIAQTGPTLQPSRPDCGFVQENGRYVYLGNCTTGVGEASDPEGVQAPASPPPPPPT